MVWFKEVAINNDFVAKMKDVEKETTSEEVMVIDLIDTSQPNIDVNINRGVMDRQLVWLAKRGLKLRQS